MATMAEQVRTHNGPIILGYGSQPFFLFGAVPGLGGLSWPLRSYMKVIFTKQLKTIRSLRRLAERG